MDLEQTLAELRAKGKPKTAQMYQRHGVKDETVGLSFGDLAKLAKRIGQNATLAQELWASRIHDARVLACKIADPQAITLKQLQAWQEDCTNYILTDAVSALTARTPHASRLAASWSKSNNEWTLAAAFNVYALLGLSSTLDEVLAEELVLRIQAHIHEAPNRARHAMNGALIAIGSGLPGIRNECLKAAGAIGKVNVDHGQTGCQTPDASSYLQKVVDHQAKQAASKLAKKKPGRVVPKRTA